MLRGRLKYAVEEIKFLKSSRDAKILLGKVRFLLPRLLNIQTESPVPPSIQIEPTNFCNAKCICCSSAHITRKRGYMDFDLFRKIIDEAQELAVGIIHLFMHGEPFLHPRIIDMIRYVKSKGLTVHVTSNCMALDKEKIDAVLHSGLDSSDYFVFSVLGNSVQTHEKIMRGINREKVLANIFEFVRRRNELGLNGPVLETIFYAMPDNMHEKTAFLDFWKGKIDHARVVEISRAFSQFEFGKAEDFTRQKTCSNLWERMIVYWNGDVTVCCQDIDGSFSFGNLHDRTIKELWAHPDLAAVKTSHKNGDFGFFSLCKHCDM